MRPDLKRRSKLRGEAGTAARGVSVASGWPAREGAPSLTVCLLSSHPGLLAEMERLLSGGEFKLKTMRLKFGSGEDFGSVHLPRAAVYVVDASWPRAATENLIEALRTRFAKARVVVVKETLKDDKVFPYLRVGVKGVVRYADVHKDLARAIKVVGHGGFWVAGPQLSRFVDSILVGRRSSSASAGPSFLTRREREVLMAILQGLSNKEIAQRLHISERTVKFHVSSLLQKFKVPRRADLIAKHYQVWPVDL